MTTSGVVHWLTKVDIKKTAVVGACHLAAWGYITFTWPLWRRILVFVNLKYVFIYMDVFNETYTSKFSGSGPVNSLSRQPQHGCNIMLL